MLGSSAPCGGEAVWIIHVVPVWSHSNSKQTYTTQRSELALGDHKME
jgi:hypothetical protein